MAEELNANKLTKADLIEKAEEIKVENEELKAQLDANKETLKHIELVRKYLNFICDKLRERADNHDVSKLESPEVEYFAKYTSKLAETTYGSPEYKQCLKEMEPALQHHYNKNDHHIEFYPNGIEDIDLIVLMEIIADWVASTDRQHDGNILKSIDDNVARFKIDKQLAKIIKNTINKIINK